LTHYAEEAGGEVFVEFPCSTATTRQPYLTSAADLQTIAAVSKRCNYEGGRDDRVISRKLSR
jgi:hypothetical protein